ncbi:MAG: hypothetical protein AB7Q29_05500, partial [Vicinamibacterales bacterium]
TALLALLSAATLRFAAVVMWNGGLAGTLGTIELRSGSPWRAILIGTAAAAALTARSLAARSVRGIRVGVALLVSAAVLALCARAGSEVWPVGDAALIELDVLRALEGRLLLGAYSRFGWHHPGPLPYYWLAPFYGLGGRTTASLTAGVVVTNLACLAYVGAVLVRWRRELPWLFAPALFALLLVYLARVPTLLISPWNPHTLMFPLLALLFAAAACLHKSPAALLAVVFLASFVIQAHVSLAGVAGILLVWCAWRLAAQWKADPTRSRAVGRIGVGAAALFQALWLLPLSEQLVHAPGNVTLIWQFFRGDDPRQPLIYAWRAWSSALALVLQPGLELADGGQLVDTSHAWLVAAGTVTLLALLFAIRRARAARRLFMFRLGEVAAVASIVGLWSAVQVRGPMGDYQIFWLSMVGIVNLAIVIGELASDALATPRVLDAVRRHHPRLVIASAVAGVAAVALVGLDQLLLPHHNPVPRAEMDTVRDLMQQLAVNLPQTGNRQPVVRLHADMWSIGAGIVLQLKRQGLETTVIKEHAWLFDDGMTTTGREDILLDIVRADAREEIARRAMNVTLAQAHGVFVEGVSLVDAPGNRPR